MHTKQFSHPLLAIAIGCTCLAVCSSAFRRQAAQDVRADDLSQVRADLDKLRGEVEAYAGQLDALQKTTAKLDIRVQASETRMTALEQRVATRTSDAAALRQE